MTMGLVRMPASGLGTAAPLAAATLVALGVELVVVGGCALVLIEYANRCGDLDVVPEPSEANISRLHSAFDELGAKRPSRRMLAMRSVTSVDSSFGRIDVMLATARREYRDLLSRSTEVRVAGVPVIVAAVADVLRLRAEFGGGVHD